MPYRGTVGENPEALSRTLSYFFFAVFFFAAFFFLATFLLATFFFATFFFAAFFFAFFFAGAFFTVFFLAAVFFFAAVFFLAGLFAAFFLTAFLAAVFFVAIVWCAPVMLGRYRTAGIIFPRAQIKLSFKLFERKFRTDDLIRVPFRTSGFVCAFSARLDYMFALKDSNLFLRAFIVLSLIGFGFYIAFERGLVQLALVSDKSYISYLIFGIYLVASVHWLYLTRVLSVERARFTEVETALAGGVAISEVRSRAAAGLIEEFLGNLERKPAAANAGVLVEAFGDEIANRHAFGYFVSDVLLRLGLLGTIVGFIFMLLPIADMEGFDAGMMQQLLTSMSGGMAVALYTTLAGLVTSTLLKLQYHIVDASAAALVTRLAVLVDVYMAEGASAPASG